MVKREDLLKIFFVKLCLLHVSPGHPCGPNPLNHLLALAEKQGRDINSLLNLLRTSSPALYRQVKDNVRRYAGCVGLVDTSYFKRSMSASSLPRTQEEGLGGQRDLEGLPRVLRRLALGTKRESRVLRLLGVMRSLSGEEAGAASAGRGGGDGRGDGRGALEGAEF